MNKALLIGRIATTPELRYTPTGVPVATFRLAVQDDIPNSKGERDTQFLSIVAWRSTAEFVCNYLGTGRLVSVDGRLKVRNWVAQDGSKRSTVEIHVAVLRALDKAPGSVAADLEDTGTEKSPVQVGSTYHEAPPIVEEETVPELPKAEKGQAKPTRKPRTKNETKSHNTRVGETSPKDKEPALVGAAAGLESNDPFTPEG